MNAPKMLVISLAVTIAAGRPGVVGNSPESVVPVTLYVAGLTGSHALHAAVAQKATEIRRVNDRAIGRQLHQKPGSGWRIEALARRRLEGITAGKILRLGGAPNQMLPIGSTAIALP
jgi:hypothetical protein